MWSILILKHVEYSLMINSLGELKQNILSLYIFFLLSSGSTDYKSPSRQRNVSKNVFEVNCHGVCI